jgi:hypothetical protein
MSAPVKLDLKYTVFDRANGVYLYQRAVPELAAPLLARKKLTISLGKSPHEARTRYLPIHTRWENAIQRAIASVVGEPDEDEFWDRLVEFLNAQAALAGGCPARYRLVPERWSAFRPIRQVAAMELGRGDGHRFAVRRQQR